jgi:hypothetical protein
MIPAADAAAEPSHLPPEGPPKRLMGPGFWLLLAFTAVCLLAGVIVAAYGPKIWRRQPAPPAAVATAPAEPSQAALKARIAELERQLAERREDPAVADRPALDASAAAALEARVDRLEAAQRRAARAASAAVAAGVLADAAQTSHPFVGELAALERIMPNSELVAGLRPLAEQGAPTRAALAAEFPDVAARAAAAAHAPKGDANFLSRALAAIGSLVTLRRVDDVTGGSPDAALARAERRVADGDLDGALEQLALLPAPAKAATADWRERARRRLEIERRVQALRAGALRDLAWSTAAPDAGEIQGAGR